MKLNIRVRMDNGEVVQRVVHNVVAGDCVRISDSVGIVVWLDAAVDDTWSWRRLWEWVQARGVRVFGPPLAVDKQEPFTAIQIDPKHKYAVVASDDLTMANLERINALFTRWLESDDPICLLRGVKFVKIEGEQS